MDWNYSDSSLESIIKTRHTPITAEGNFQQLEDRRKMYPYNMQFPNLMMNKGNLDGFSSDTHVSSKHYEQDDEDEGIFDMDL
jgi:hypothetical protein